MSEDRRARIETALAELPTKTDLAHLRSAIAPGPSVSGVGEMVRAQDGGSDLHFRTGRRGKLARFLLHAARQEILSMQLLFSHA